MRNNYQEYAYTKMPWGKYKGYFIKDLPTDYVKWAIQNYQDAGMAQMMAVELQRREPKWRNTSNNTIV